MSSQLTRAKQPHFVMPNTATTRKHRFAVLGGPYALSEALASLMADVVSQDRVYACQATTAATMPRTPAAKERPDAAHLQLLSVW